MLGLAFVPALFDDNTLTSCRSGGAYESERLPQADSMKQQVPRCGLLTTDVILTTVIFLKRTNVASVKFKMINRLKL